MALLTWLRDWATARGLAAVRAAAAEMRAVYAAQGLVEELDPDPVATDIAVLSVLSDQGPQTAAYLRIGGLVTGALRRNAAIERLAREGIIGCRLDGRWTLRVKGA
ncbi:MAG: hypothetical protein WCG26_06425 [Chloroflexales bacterium]